MDTLAILSLLIATIVSTAHHVKSSPMIAEDLRLSEEDGEETHLEGAEPERQERIGTFLALLDKLERSASSSFISKLTGVRAGTKLLGKRNRMEEQREEHPISSFHQEESVDQIEDLTENNPMRGRHFKKVSQSLTRKGKKRACFWKYCIQNK